MNKRFVTLFPYTANIHLFKDVGMVPFLLNKLEQWDATVACYKNGEYPAIENELKGLKVVFIKKIFGNEELDGLFFILTNFWKYDVLQMYHFQRSSLLVCFFFKLLTFGRKKTYVKLDANDGIMQPIPNSIRKKLNFFLLKRLDIISVETKKLHRYLNENWPVKVHYIPNGFYDNDKRIDTKYSEKGNVILSVGRIGENVKSNDTLCEAFATFYKENKDWKLKFVGSVTDSFKSYLENFFLKNPEVAKAIEFVGPIYDKEQLMDYYKTAKIFVHTSLYESFGLVYLEAMQRGCYIISSEITPAFDITDNETYGQLFKVRDIDGLVEKIRMITSNPQLIEKNTFLIQQYVYEHFYWPKIVTRISNLLLNKVS